MIKIDFRISKGKIVYYFNERVCAYVCMFVYMFVCVCMCEYVWSYVEVIGYVCECVYVFDFLNGEELSFYIKFSE